MFPNSGIQETLEGEMQDANSVLRKAEEAAQLAIQEAMK